MELANALLFGTLHDVLLSLSEDGQYNDLFIGDRHSSGCRVFEIEDMRLA